jgi:hypothetical protein
MGIDVYMHWTGQTDEERESQFTGFVTAGETGYLREAYGAPDCATRILVPEGFNEDGPEEGEPIPAATLVDRLEAAAYAAHRRYPDDPERERQHVESLTAFVELAKRKERETGEPVRVLVSW